MKRINLLGSTGSVGEQTLAVVADFPDRYCIETLGAGRNIKKLAGQVKRFSPKQVAVADAACADKLKSELAGSCPPIVWGEDGLCQVASADCDLVVSALVGAVGLRPTLAAIRAGHSIALANKEVLVMAGALVQRELAHHRVALLPVDSEHSALFQAVDGQRRQDVSRMILTASGGPFRSWEAERIVSASIEEALNHPNWEMGPKITVDSASMMNKGLEVIEARWLFDLPPEQIEVVVHPQSIVHSIVEFQDCSQLAQLGLPDMRVPIAYALSYPERLPLNLPRLDLASCRQLDFEAPDLVRFPCLGLAYEALRGDEAAPAALNAANEVSVAAFLRADIPFGGISATNEKVLGRHLSQAHGKTMRDINDVLEVDGWARAQAAELLD